MTTFVDIFDHSSQAYKRAKRQHLKATKNRPSEVELDWTPFRAAEKRYKARFPPPDLRNVLDLATLDETRIHEIDTGIWRGSSKVALYTELIPKDGGGPKAYTIPSVPGLVILPSFVSCTKQRDLVEWSLSKHARYPNDTNLDIHYSLPQEGIWNAHLSQQEITIQPKTLDQTVPVQPPDPPLFAQTTPDPSSTLQPSAPSDLVSKLRWANIGWFYHWGTKQYDFTKGKGVIDDEIRDICKKAVNKIDWELIYGNSDTVWSNGMPEWKAWDETYEPDAGIVNFYQNKDTLMGHVDRSEVCATSPLVSISLGNAAVFLIGGLTRDVEPIPILLRSGDVVIMSGPTCRRAYHGVPRILEGTLPSHMNEAVDGLSSEWEPYRKYLQTTRININVRQVFPKGFTHDVTSGV
ncbi:hypothetical protein BD779DRAFT_1797519 [Infundibulicybe gibba]|nr:hypothetical protein BD779DRAFT_1797519 [Infundibulicybe gibba]